ncbi:MAG: phosphate ABC transporter permease subunit PstC [Actinomycetota bacterium]
MKARKIREILLSYLFLFCALAGAAGVLLIFIFVGVQGFPILQRVGVVDFLLSSDWLPTRGHFGILPMIMGTLAVTLGALILGAPLGIATAIFMAEVAPDQMRRILRPVVELLAGIPSVVYGFLGIVLLIPWINKIDGPNYSGFGILTASLILTVMILPTIVNIAEDAIRAVPQEYRDASFALAATHWQTIRGTVLPAARSGIFTSIILGMGRAIGETMAVLMVIGNPAIIPKSIFSPAASLTSIIVLDMSYASGDHRTALFAIGIVLFAITITLIALAYRFSSDGGRTR